MSYASSPGVRRRKIITEDCTCLPVWTYYNPAGNVVPAWVSGGRCTIRLWRNPHCPIHSGTPEEREAYIEQEMERR